MSCIGWCAVGCQFGELSVAVQVYVDYRTRVARSSNIGELLAVVQEVLDQHNLDVRARATSEYMPVLSVARLELDFL